MKKPIKFVIMFMLFGLLLGIVYYVSFSYASLEEGVNKNLSEILNQRTELINNFLEVQKQKIVEISKADVFKEFLEYPDKRLYLLDDINNMFQDDIREDSLIDAMFVLSPQGDLLINTQEGYTPVDVFKEFDFSLEKEGRAYVKPIRFCYCAKEYVLDVTTPVYDDFGKLIGLIATRTDVSNLASLVKQQGNFSDLQRVYLLDSHGLLISSSILSQEKHRNFIQNVDNENARKCFNEKNEKDKISHAEFVAPFSNYLGEKVVGVYKYFPDPEWCLLVEDDINSIYNMPKRDILIKNIIFILVFIIILGMLGYFLGKRFNKNRKRR